VPFGAGDHATVALAAIPQNERVLYLTHKVRRGDTLSAISRRYGVDMASIQQANQMGRKTLIRVNQSLRIPTSSAGHAVSAGQAVADVHQDSTSSAPEIVTYRVRKGDTLTRISKHHGTTPKVIAALSGISVDRTLRVGDRLRISRGVRTLSEVAPSAKSRGQSVQHTVKSGDTLWGIATLYETTVRVLCSLNSISPSTVLLPGAKLTVRYE
jgi:LysM repeat protein